MLNERRSEATEVTPEAYDALVGTLRVFLDGCAPRPAVAASSATAVGAVAAAGGAAPPPTTAVPAATTAGVVLAEKEGGGSLSPSPSLSPVTTASLAGAFVGPPSTRRRRKSGSFVSVGCLCVCVCVLWCRRALLCSLCCLLILL